MKIGYADPPYVGCCAMYDHFHGEDGLCWDNLSTHALLFERLRSEFPDGWAVSCSSVSLPDLLRTNNFRDARWKHEVRVAAWVKTFAAFKVHVNPAYAWEPVIWCGGRMSRPREEPTVRDWCAAPITLRRGFTGAKPESFSHWLFQLLGLRRDDEFVDLFPGSGAVTQAWSSYQRQSSLFEVTL